MLITGFLLWPRGQGSGIATAVAQVTAVALVRSLVQKIPYAMGTAKKKKRERESEMPITVMTL